MTVGPLSQHRGEPSVLAVEEEELSRSETVLTVVTIAGLLGIACGLHQVLGAVVEA